MKSSIEELTKKISALNKNIDTELLLIEHSINICKKKSKSAPRDRVLLNTEKIVKEIRTQKAEIQSIGYFESATGHALQLSNIYVNSNGNISALNKEIGQGHFLSTPLEKHLFILYDKMLRQFNILVAEFKKFQNKYKKFLATEEILENDVDIYINLLKILKKKPTLEALSESTLNTTSKSTWERRLKDQAFIVSVQEKINKLISRTNNKKRKEYYQDILFKLRDNLLEALQRARKKDSRREKGQIVNKIKSGKDPYSEPVDSIDYFSDKNQHRDWENEKD